MPPLLHQYWICLIWIFCSLFNATCGVLCLNFVKKCWQPDRAFKTFLAALIVCDIVSSVTYFYQAGYHLFIGYVTSFVDKNLSIDNVQSSIDDDRLSIMTSRQCYETLLLRFFGAEAAGSFLFVLALDRFVLVVCPKFYEKCFNGSPLYVYVTLVEVLLGQAFLVLVGFWANAPKFDPLFCSLASRQTGYRSPFFHWVNFALGAVSRIAPVLLYMIIWQRLARLNRSQNSSKTDKAEQGASVDRKLVEFVGLLVFWQLIAFTLQLLAQNWYFGVEDDRLAYLEVTKMSLGVGSWVIFWFNRDKHYYTLN